MKQPTSKLDALQRERAVILAELELQKAEAERTARMISGLKKWLRAVDREIVASGGES